MIKVFLSHATADKELVDSIETLIEQGIGLAHHEVFCSSLEGMDIPAGSPDFKEYIREKMTECELVVAVISENYYASPFCMCELGAVWVLAKDFFPILVPPVDFKDLRGALTGMQCTKLEEKSTASKLYDRISKLVEKPVAVTRWDTRKTIFYDNLPAILGRMKKPNIVTLGVHKQVEHQRDEANALNVELQQEIDQKDLLITRLSAAKDAKEVAEIKKELSSELEQYREVVKQCKDTLRKVPRIVREALFYQERGDNFTFISASEWGEFERANENEELTRSRSGDNYLANSERPNIQHAQAAISDLRDFLTKITGECYELVVEGLGDTPDLRRRSYWEDNRFF